MKPVSVFILILFGIFAVLDNAMASGSGDDLFASGLEAYDGGDYATARSDWLRAADLGHVDAMTALADLMMQGQGGPVDHRGAVDWYYKAAKLGDATASLSLGMLALGKPEDPVKNYLAAFVWLSVSAKQGNAWAKEAVSRLKGKLSESERAMADRLIRKNKLPRF